MNREIKFRAYDPEQGVTVHFGLLDISAGGAVVCVDCECVDIRNEEGERVVVTQYTGLKDKNGVEIYEGDIVHIYTNLENYYIDVIWDEDGCWTLGRPDGTHGELGFWPCEIVGNIYENPKLMDAYNEDN